MLETSSTLEKLVSAPSTSHRNARQEGKAMTAHSVASVIRRIQLILGHSNIKRTQRYLNITDEELRKALSGVSERGRQLKAVGE